VIFGIQGDGKVQTNSVNSVQKCLVFILRSSQALIYFGVAAVDLAFKIKN
jgi:hypothetical protein